MSHLNSGKASPRNGKNQLPPLEVWFLDLPHQHQLPPATYGEMSAPHSEKTKKEPPRTGACCRQITARESPRLAIKSLSAVVSQVSDDHCLGRTQVSDAGEDALWVKRGSI